MLEGGWTSRSAFLQLNRNGHKRVQEVFALYKMYISHFWVSICVLMSAFKCRKQLATPNSPTELTTSADLPQSPVVPVPLFRTQDLFWASGEATTAFRQAASLKRPSSAVCAMGTAKSQIKRWLVITKKPANSCRPEKAE